MSRTLRNYVVRTYLAFGAAIFGGLLAIFLVADFVDRAKYYQGPNWATDALVLYGFKALVAVQQLGPAALLLAAGATVSAFRKRGELTAIRALTFGPRALFIPIGATAVLLGLLLILFDEAIVVKAGRHVDEITTQRFHRWGDYQFHFTPKRWFRREGRVFYLRQGDAQSGYGDVTVFTLSEDFRLSSRLDAKRMEYLGDNRWRLQGVVERAFVANGATPVRVVADGEYDLGVSAAAFNIHLGRPEQMHLAELSEQIRTRRRVGLPTHAFVLAWHNRISYPLAGVPAALVAVGLALRPHRSGHLTAATLEGMSVAVTLWGLMVLCKGLALAERVRPPTASWLPVGLLVAAAAALWLRAEGPPHGRRV